MGQGDGTTFSLEEEQQHLNYAKANEPPVFTRCMVFLERLVSLGEGKVHRGVQTLQHKHKWHFHQLLLKNLHRDFFLGARLLPRLEKVKIKATLTLSPFLKDAAVVPLSVRQLPSSQQQLLVQLFSSKSHADDSGCLANNCASKTDTGEGTCFLLVFHPVAPDNGFSNSSKAPAAVI